MYLSIENLPGVLSATFDARHKWFSVGLVLRVDNGTLNAIKQRCHDDPDECFREMLSHCLQTPSGLTWVDLVRALRSDSVGYGQLANNIAKDHCPALIVNDTNVAIDMRPSYSEGFDCYKASLRRRCIAWVIDVMLLTIFIIHFPETNTGFNTLIQKDDPTAVVNVLSSSFDFEQQPEEVCKGCTTMFKYLAAVILVDILVESILLAMFSATPGKWMMGLRVISCVSSPELTETKPGYSIRVEKGRKPTFLQALGRSMYKSILKNVTSFFQVIVIWCQLDTKGRTHYDRLFKTVVIQKH